MVSNTLNVARYEIMTLPQGNQQRRQLVVIKETNMPHMQLGVNALKDGRSTVSWVLTTIPSHHKNRI